MPQLHAFFTEFYDALYARPELFGLPLSEDTFIGENEPDPKEKKQIVKRQLDKPRGSIMAGLDFFQLAGSQGWPGRASAGAERVRRGAQEDEGQQALPGRI